ncbi:helix-turn-helix domain-containing protein [Streptomyces sp. NPDC057429]|uniref:helix-turn-helix domain-containing protein n=1 Tax=Streptomyces sp. NPDC057429 TaxID=3346130 RepID=UPI0036A717C1
MPVALARPITLTNAERERLKKSAYGHKTPYQTRQRAAIVLHATRGRANARIARETGLHLDTVRTWRGRFADGGLPALVDRKRSGRPARFTPVQVAEAKALACQLPAETGVPLSRWSCPELAAELTARGITDTVSASTVRRWLREDALKPWQYRSWIFIRDLDFRVKAQHVLDLYATSTAHRRGDPPRLHSRRRCRFRSAARRGPCDTASRSAVVLSVCPPQAAEDIATAVAAHGFAGVYVDVNAISPTALPRASRTWWHLLLSRGAMCSHCGPWSPTVPHGRRRRSRR